MVRRRSRSLRCPTCRKLVLKREPQYPFCSERCRLIDLGKWASGAYVISSPIQEDEPPWDTEDSVEKPPAQSEIHRQPEGRNAVRRKRS